ncbi:MAG TPA: tetratricopeptide repeat protein [Gemmatimonadaceae bacterium]|nr:tetratricopeptide repeat protein [Gemmatimonadaceae bacterium]
MRAAMLHEDDVARRSWGLGDDSTEPPRPPLPAGSDTNDAAAYVVYALGAARRSPREASRAFYWASRLDPSRADALYGRFAMLGELVGGGYHIVDHRARYDPGLSPAASRHIDSLMYFALVRDPFLNDRLSYEPPPTDSFYLKRRLKDPLFAGMLAYSEGHFREAAAKLGEALRKRPNSITLRVGRAHALYYVAQYDSAIAELSRAIATIETHEQEDIGRVYISKEMFHYAIGMIDARLGELDSARLEYQRAIAENLGFYMAHARLAGVDLVSGDTATALVELRTAAEIQPDDPALRYYLGYTLLQAGRVDDAAAELREALRLDRHWAAPHEALGRALAARGDTTGAAAEYTEYLAHAPRSAALADDVRARLAALGRGGSTGSRE